MDTTQQGKGHDTQYMAQSAAQTMSDIKHTAQEWGATMTEQANTAATAVGQLMSSLAGTIRHHAPADGMMGSAAASMANQLEAAGSYLQDHSCENMARDLAGVIRRYPLQSLVVGITLGYLWARNAER
jgi:hypothetical protein